MSSVLSRNPLAPLVPSPTQVYGDATILFPLLVSQTFARHWRPLDPPRDKPQEENPGEDGVFKATFD
jgi:hypothetical protein